MSNSEHRVGVAFKLVFLSVLGILVFFIVVCIWISSFESPTELQNQLFENCNTMVKVLGGAIAGLLGGKTFG